METIEQSGTLLYNPITEAIYDVSCWQNLDQEEVKKDFRDGHVVGFSATSTLEMYPSIIVIGGGDTKWVAWCAFGKENMSGAHWNHCQHLKIGFHLG
jgi:hypothetical protein